MIELVLRTTESSGLVKGTDSWQGWMEVRHCRMQDPILEYSGLCIDSLRHQAFYQGQEIL